MLIILGFTDYRRQSVGLRAPCRKHGAMESSEKYRAWPNMSSTIAPMTFLLWEPSNIGLRGYDATLAVIHSNPPVAHATDLARA
jgi:hypothetical protein